MALPQMTRQLAHAAATDAANRRMRKAGRTKWSRADYNAAVREFNRLWPEARRQAAAWRRSHKNPTKARSWPARLGFIRPIGRRARTLEESDYSARVREFNRMLSARRGMPKREAREYFGSHGKNPAVPGARKVSIQPSRLGGEDGFRIMLGRDFYGWSPTRGGARKVAYGASVYESKRKPSARRFPATTAGARRALAYANQMRRRGRPVSIWKT